MGGPWEDFGGKTEPAPELSKEQKSLIDDIVGRLKDTLIKDFTGTVPKIAALIGGGIAGAPLGPAGAVAGAGLAYGGVSQAERFLKGEQAENLWQAAMTAGKDVLEGAAMEAGGQIVGAGVNAAKPYIKKAAEKVYSSAMKPSTTIPPAERKAVIETGLQSEIPITKKGLGKLQANISRLDQQITRIIDQGSAAQGATIDSVNILKRLNGLKQFYQNTQNPQAYLDTITALEKDFINAHGKTIPIGVAQKIKQNTYALIKNAYGELSTASKEGQKNIARGIKEELADIFPELNTLNAKESALIKLNKQLERAVSRSENVNIIGVPEAAMGAGLGAGGYALRGKEGAMTGLSMALAFRALRSPAVQSQIAFMLNKVSGTKATPAYVSSRIATYLAGQGFGVNQNPVNEMLTGESPGPWEAYSE